MEEDLEGSEQECTKERAAPRTGSVAGLPDLELEKENTP